MFLSYLRVFDTPSSYQKPLGLALGIALDIASVDASKRDLSIGVIVRNLECAFQQNRVIFIEANDGTIVGYVVFALLTDDVEKKFIVDGGFRIHRSEWNEGNSFWITDFSLGLGGHMMSLRRTLRVIFAGFSCINYFDLRREHVQIHSGSGKLLSKCRMSTSLHYDGENPQAAELETIGFIGGSCKTSGTDENCLAAQAKRWGWAPISGMI